MLFISNNRSAILMAVYLTLAAHALTVIAADDRTAKQSKDSTSGGSAVSTGTDGQIGCERNCEDDVGDSCRADDPCCSPLVCFSGRCQPQVPGVTCYPPNVRCNPASPIQCCTAFNQACLFVPAFNAQYCQPCLPLTSACNPAVPAGFVGSCCPGTQCVNNICVRAVVG